MFSERAPGDLTDSADGHLEIYFANLFGRYQSGRWGHTLILARGWNDVKLNLTVNYGEGGYGTQGCLPQRCSFSLVAFISSAGFLLVRTKADYNI